MAARKNLLKKAWGSSDQSELSLQNMFYVYILQSLKDFSFYVGQCQDLDARMSKHFEGMSKYTKGKRPWRLRYFESYNTRTESLKREKQIKNMKSTEYIQQLIMRRFL